MAKLKRPWEILFEQQQQQQQQQQSFSEDSDSDEEQLRAITRLVEVESKQLLDDENDSFLGFPLRSETSLVNADHSISSTSPEEYFASRSGPFGNLDGTPSLDKGVPSFGDNFPIPEEKPKGSWRKADGIIEFHKPRTNLSIAQLSADDCVLPPSVASTSQPNSAMHKSTPRWEPWVSPPITADTPAQMKEVKPRTKLVPKWKQFMSPPSPPLPASPPPPPREAPLPPASPPCTPLKEEKEKTTPRTKLVPKWKQFMSPPSPPLPASPPPPVSSPPPTSPPSPLRRSPSPAPVPPVLKVLPPLPKQKSVPKQVVKTVTIQEPSKSEFYSQVIDSTDELPYIAPTLSFHELTVGLQAKKDIEDDDILGSMNFFIINENPKDISYEVAWPGFRFDVDKPHGVVCANKKKLITVQFSGKHFKQQQTKEVETNIWVVFENEEVKKIRVKVSKVVLPSTMVPIINTSSVDDSSVLFTHATSKPSTSSSSKYSSAKPSAASTSSKYSSTRNNNTKLDVDVASTTKVPRDSKITTTKSCENFIPTMEIGLTKSVLNFGEVKVGEYKEFLIPMLNHGEEDLFVGVKSRGEGFNLGIKSQIIKIPAGKYLKVPLRFAPKKRGKMDFQLRLLDEEERIVRLTFQGVGV